MAQDPERYISIESLEGHKSTLVMRHDYLEVMGALPHGHKFTPHTLEDCVKLIEHFQAVRHRMTTGKCKQRLQQIRGEEECTPTKSTT